MSLFSRMAAAWSGGQCRTAGKFYAMNVQGKASEEGMREEVRKGGGRQARRGSGKETETEGSGEGRKKMEGERKEKEKQIKEQGKVY